MSNTATSDNDPAALRQQAPLLSKDRSPENVSNDQRPGVTISPRVRHAALAVAGALAAGWLANSVGAWAVLPLAALAGTIQYVVTTRSAAAPTAEPAEALGTRSSRLAAFSSARSKR